MNKGMFRLQEEIEKQQRWRASANGSVVSSLYGVCIEIKKIKNMVKNVYIPTDNTDIGKFIGENLYCIDFSIIFNIRRKSSGNLPMSVLSVPYMEYVLKLIGLKIW